MKRYILFLSFLIINCQSSIASVRYVSHSGSNTPPYLTWQTAADSIMSAINISSFGDTIYVANGIYEERVTMIPGLSMIGAGMDSCIINSSNVTIPSGTYSVKVTDSCYVSGFQIIPYFNNSQGIGIYIYDSNIATTNNAIINNKILNSALGIRITSSSLGTDIGKKLITMNMISNVEDGIYNAQTKPIISNNIIYPKGSGLVSGLISSPTYLNNIVVMENGNNTAHGFGSGFDLESIVKNNLFISLDNSGEAGMYSYSDSLINNLVFGGWDYGIFTAGSIIRNNHIQKSGVGMRYDIGGGSTPIFEYNNLWENQTNFQSYNSDSTNIFFDPMFLNEDSLDFHLQMYSPIIDAGDPAILDQDSSRSDIGLYGGPFGENYRYLDLPPRTPINFTAVLDTEYIILTWNRNTEADLSNYNLYRDTVQGFTVDSSNLVASLIDTFYLQVIPSGIKNFYFRITAVDNQGNESEPTEEKHIEIVSVKDRPKIFTSYQLYQNYPNPFNPATKIGYRLKERGYVKLYVYDLKGELIETIVNKYQEGGYYEVKFPASSIQHLASGIYIYQIMVRNEQDIPVFTDIKKMLLIK